MLLPKLTDDFYSLVSQWLARIQSVLVIPPNAKIHMRHDGNHILIAIQVIPVDDMQELLDWTNTDSYVVVPENSENTYVCTKFNNFVAELYMDVMTGDE